MPLLTWPLVNQNRCDLPYLDNSVHPGPQTHRCDATPNIIQQIVRGKVLPISTPCKILQETKIYNTVQNLTSRRNPKDLQPPQQISIYIYIYTYIYIYISQPFRPTLDLKPNMKQRPTSYGPGRCLPAPVAL